uniref:Retrovirus-related Pol polyprotein from transposon opus n=1 Tax=Cajanus cajan TaxID=3821 RepID=A0A151U9P6_CAJCA|nr:Retrovirus-related Pol polyprotein from transposon opus [Cajanus cajan]
MPGIDVDFIYHRLAIHKEARPVAQRKRKVGGERREAIITETQTLLNVGCFREVRYTTWLANVVLVKRMCVDYTDLNRACPKDSYPLPSIDRLVDGASGHALLIYVDDMVVKTTSAADHAADLVEVFGQLSRHNMRLNPEKCVFGVQGGKFLGFMITSRGIKANLEKCKAIIQMQSPQTVKDVQRLVGSRILQDTEKRYQMIEKMALALVTAARRLRPYFQSHQVVVKTDYPIKQILRKPELAGRMITWSVELSEFDIQYGLYTLTHVPREQNTIADLLSKLASTKRPGQHRTIIQETLYSPSLDDKIVNTSNIKDQGWMTGIWSYLKAGVLPEDGGEARKMRLRSSKFVIIVEHPQTNGQVEAANKVILRELKKRLGNAKGQWADELPSILWAYHCTPQSTTQETPYMLTYGTDAMILVEIGEISHRKLKEPSQRLKTFELAADLDLVDELRDEAQIHEEACKLRASRRYNTRVRPRSFRVGDLVWRLLGEAQKDTSDGKLAPTGGGPFRIAEDLENGTYRLEELSGKPIPRTWNATHLKFYFS